MCDTLLCMTGMTDLTVQVHVSPEDVPEEEDSPSLYALVRVRPHLALLFFLILQAL